MTFIDFSYDDFENTRETLVEIIQKRLSGKDKEFLLSFETGEPKWELFSVEKVQDLPAVKWKLQNIGKLRETNPDKHKKQIEGFRKNLNF